MWAKTVQGSAGGSGSSEVLTLLIDHRTINATTFYRTVTNESGQTIVDDTFTATDSYGNKFNTSVTFQYKGHTIVWAAKDAYDFNNSFNSYNYVVSSVTIDGVEVTSNYIEPALASGSTTPSALSNVVKVTTKICI